MKRLLAFLISIFVVACAYPQTQNVTLKPTGSGSGTFNTSLITTYVAPTGSTWDFTNATVLGINSSGTGTFTLLGVGATPTGTFPINFAPIATASSNNLKALRLSPTMYAVENTDTLYNFIMGGTIFAGGYSGTIYQGVTLGTPTIGSGTLSSAVQLYIYAAPAATTKYGIFQAGTDVNQLNNLKLTPGGGGSITFADGTIQTTAGGGGGGGVTSIIAGTGITTNASTGSVTINASGTAGVTSASGTANQVLVNATSGTAQTGAITLTTPQSIGTASSPQFFSIGLGSGAGPLAGAISILGNYYGQSLFSTSPFGIADTPTLVAAANSESFTGLNVTPVLNPATYTSLSYYGINLGTPSGGSSSVSTAYQLYIAAAPTATTKYGIYQAGTDNNVLSGSLQIPSLGVGKTASGTSGDVQINNNLEVGANYSSDVGVNLQPSVTVTTSSLKGVRISPTLTSAATNDTLYNVITGGTIVGGSATSLTYDGLTLGTPSISSGTLSTSSQLLIYNGPTATTHYGINQVGTDPNLFAGIITTPSLTLTSGGGGRITFADGTTQSTAASGSGGVAYVSGGTGITTNANTGSVVITNSGVTALTGTTDQVIASASTGAVTLSLPQSINTTSTPRFGQLAIGAAVSAQAGIVDSAALSASTSFGIIDNPTITMPFAGTAEGIVINPTLALGTNTSLTYYGLALQTPSTTGTLSGAFSTSYQLYINSGVTATNAYGIYQAGTNPNVFGGAVTVPAFTATGTTTLATSLTGSLQASSGVVSAIANTGTGNNVLATSPTIVTPVIAQINDSNSNATLKLLSITSAVNQVSIENGATGNPPHIYSTGSDTNIGLHLQAKGTGYVNVQGSVDATKRLAFNPDNAGTTGTYTLLQTSQTASRTITLPDATDTLVGKATTDTFTNKAISGSTNTLTNIPNSALTNSSITFGATAAALGTTVSGFNAVTIGASTAAAGTFTALTATGTTTLATSLTGALSASSGVVSAGTLSIANGGTGQTTAAAAQRALTPATSTVTTGASPSVNWSLSNSFDLTLTSATAASMAFTNAQDGQVITIAIHQPASGTPTTVSWSGITTILWAGGTAPTQTATLSKTDVYTFYYNATAAKYYGSYVQNF